MKKKKKFLRSKEIKKSNFSEESCENKRIYHSIFLNTLSDIEEKFEGKRETKNFFTKLREKLKIFNAFNSLYTKKDNKIYPNQIKETTENNPLN